MLLWNQEELFMEFQYEAERIFTENEEGKVIAEVTFPLKDGIATINHTFVDESLRGQGVAGQLVQSAVDQIIKDGHRISATCPYAVSWLGKHPEYEAVDAGTPQACSIGKH
jgi:predicted GNAT family acetyltransferase